ncbi:E3 ubiquitin-protein ligase PRT1 [Juglans microcarpa x Juglans regia]|uniref:E3 ubiquitin-protein ligase PRT1 n=1 Tax=Juglans microcarpa x Juglans regia TaxID=2249226 RepID=UPI001B7F0CE7|nr:E3 ubiquitin-protein ligase PRT1 [Juglans microcarpa x Juglans regia]
MEDPNTHDNVDSEKISESFLCCICLELLYKPVVLSCGHISCFWCVHKSMDIVHESHCPICRHPYNHFPTICQMLHLLLLKEYPIAYKRRENQILEEEKETGIFSPQFNFQAYNHGGNLASLSIMDFESKLPSDSLSTRKGEPYANLELLNSDSQVQDDGVCALIEIHNGNSEVIGNVSLKENTSKQVSVSDVLCLACKQLLFCPVVLNCGHVYCESCIIIPAGEMLKCQVCQTLHPRGFPKVCLELDHYLEQNFPKEYVLRRDAVQLKQVDFERSTESREQGKNPPWLAEPYSNAHIAVGCDSCGIVPIIGDRYKCKDCVEKVGFDLCGDCYNSRSKLPGRFNQQHTPEHKFELVRPNPGSMLRLVTVQLGDNSTAFLVDTYASEDSENGSPPPALPSDAQENADSSSAANVASTDGGEDQTGSQSTS